MKRKLIQIFLIMAILEEIIVILFTKQYSFLLVLGTTIGFAGVFLCLDKGELFYDIISKIIQFFQIKHKDEMRKSTFKGVSGIDYHFVRVYFAFVNILPKDDLQEHGQEYIDYLNDELGNRRQNSKELRKIIISESLQMGWFVVKKRFSNIIQRNRKTVLIHK
jgi:hypothetical protein